jgi:hypothetical protein
LEIRFADEISGDPMGAQEDGASPCSPGTPPGRANIAFHEEEAKWHMKKQAGRYGSILIAFCRHKARAISRAMSRPVFLDSLDVRLPSLFPGSDTGLICETWGLEAAVIPAKAGIHSASLQKCAVYELDLRFRGNDRRFERDPTASDTAAQALALCAGRGFRDRLRVFRRTSGSLVLAREISEEENV